jgi:hypothetical protein
MMQRSQKSLMRCLVQLLPAAGLTVLLMAPAYGQRNNRPAGPPPTPEANATIDITGYWVSVVTEDWRWRMVTPKRGDYPSIPLTPEGRKIADSWDPAKDTAAGLECKAYGAPGVMRLPTRLHITWQDPTTLKIEADNGTQTRLIHFMGQQAFDLQSEGEPVPDLAASAPSLQGVSLAVWEFPGEPARGPRPKGGNLKVVTRNLLPGYLQKNGVPYSANTVLTEYFNRLDEPNGDSWLLDISSMVDPQYLRATFIRSTNYKREPDGSKWDPSPCSAK